LIFLDDSSDGYCGVCYVNCFFVLPAGQAAAFLDSDQSNAKAVVFVTDKSYESGEQVFISYGKRSSGELLLAYGFIPPELNPHDFVELELALNEEDPLYDAKLAALREQGLSSYP
jgi:hypothetical protein